VLVRVAEFHVTTFAQLEQRAKAVKWNAWVAKGGRVRFRVTCKKSKLYHSDAVAQRLGTALTGIVRGATIVAGSADDDDSDDAAQLFVVRLSDNVCTISADAAGAALHRRGYRLAVAKAPIARDARGGDAAWRRVGRFDGALRSDVRIGYARDRSSYDSAANCARNTSYVCGGALAGSEPQSVGRCARGSESAGTTARNNCDCWERSR